MRDIVEDVKLETAAGIQSFMAKEEEWTPTVDVADLGCLGRCRGWLLYHWAPYDHAIGWQMTDPVYITMKVLAALPFFGTQALVYLFLFLLHDKRDDYQMVSTPGKDWFDCTRTLWVSKSTERSEIWLRWLACVLYLLT